MRPSALALPVSRSKAVKGGASVYLAIALSRKLLLPNVIVIYVI